MHRYDLLQATTPPSNSTVSCPIFTVRVALLCIAFLLVYLSPLSAAGQPDWVRVKTTKDLEKVTDNTKAVWVTGATNELLSMICERCSPAYLSLRRSRLTTASTSVLESQGDLEYLDLSMSHMLTSDDIQGILSAQGDLVHLNISFTPATDQALLAWDGGDSLRELRIAGCAVTDEALAHVITECAELTHLVISTCSKLTSESLLLLPQLESLCSIEAIGCPGMTKRVCDKMASMRKLIHVDIRGCPPLSNDGMEWLEGLSDIRFLGIEIDDSVEAGDFRSIDNFKHLCELRIDVPTDTDVINLLDAAGDGLNRVEALAIRGGRFDSSISSLCSRLQSVELIILVDTLGVKKCHLEEILAVESLTTLDISCPKPGRETLHQLQRRFSKVQIMFEEEDERQRIVRRRYD